MLLPNTYLIGAPKAGTTSLAETLAEHEAVFLPAMKEPQFWAQDFGRNITDLTAYSNLYSHSHEKESILLDASTHYMRSDTAIQNILNAVPSAKFIAIFRDPLEAVPALHNQLIYNGDVTNVPIEVACKSETYKDRICSPFFYNYIYTKNLQHISKKQLLNISFLNLICDPERTILELCAFLEINKGSELTLKTMNKSRNVRSVRLYKSFIDAGKLSITIKRALGVEKEFGLFTFIRKKFISQRSPRAPSKDFLKRLKIIFDDDLHAFEERAGLAVRGTLWNEH